MVLIFSVASKWGMVFIGHVYLHLYSPRTGAGLTNLSINILLARGLFTHRFRIAAGWGYWAAIDPRNRSAARARNAVASCFARNITSSAEDTTNFPVFYSYLSEERRVYYFRHIDMNLKVIVIHFNVKINCVNGLKCVLGEYSSI